MIANFAVATKRPTLVLELVVRSPNSQYHGTQYCDVRQTFRFDIKKFTMVF